MRSIQFIHSAFRSFIQSFSLSFIHSVIQPFVHSFSHSFIQSFIHLFSLSFFLPRLRALENSAASPTGPGHRGFSNPGFATLGEEAQQVGKPLHRGIYYVKWLSSWEGGGGGGGGKGGGGKKKLGPWGGCVRDNYFFREKKAMWKVRG